MSEVLLLLSLYIFMAWTGTNLLLHNTNYNTLLFALCWITEKWNLNFPGSSEFSLLQSMRTDSGNQELSPWRWGLKMCGAKPPIHSPHMPSWHDN
jgi:hypothetical protein